MYNSNLDFRAAVPGMSALGVIRTPFLRAKGTPIQVAAAGSTQGVVEVYPEFAEGLKDVEGFERIWLIYLLDRASAPQLIARPYLDDQERGVFATRSPARSPSLMRIELLRISPVFTARCRDHSDDRLDAFCARNCSLDGLPGREQQRAG